MLSNIKSANQHRRIEINLRRSKLETCLSILETLGSHGSLKITHVMQKANLNCNVLKNYLDFLIKQGAVEEKCVDKGRIVYGITERGVYLIRYFRELDHVIPTMKISQIRSTRTQKELNQRLHREYC
jgi:predicted transcriptional regulator